MGKIKARIEYSHGSGPSIRFNLYGRTNGQNEIYQALSSQEIDTILKNPSYRGCCLDVSGLNDGWSRHFKSTIR